MDQPSIELGEITRSDQLRHPFSLSCSNCDAGMDIETPEQAVLQGWYGIYEDDGMSWNYLGTCPQCLAQERRDTEETRHRLRAAQRIKKPPRNIPNPIPGD